jgi:hypothetical protein
MNKLVETLTALVADLRGQIQSRISGEVALSEREKIGLVAGAATLLLAMWLGLSTWVGRTEKSYHDLQFNLTRLKTQVESGAWSDRKKQAHVTRSVLEDRFWTAETPGLAEASFERWIRDRLSAHAVEAQQIQVRRVPLSQASGTDTAGSAQNTALAGLQRMTAKVFAPFNEDALIQFLGDVAESNKVIVVDRLTVRAGRNARVEMDVSTYFRYHERNP